jgi:hypothetical protein
LIQAPIRRLIMNRSNRPIPEALVPLQQQFEQFRATHPPRSKLPQTFWSAATELAKEHGLYPVAHALRLDYMGLKKRVGSSARRRRTPTQPRFVELIAPPTAKLDECVIEFESARGAKMRIQWRAAAPPDWAGLLRAWRQVEE